MHQLAFYDLQLWFSTPLRCVLVMFATLVIGTCGLAANEKADLIKTYGWLYNPNSPEGASTKRITGTAQGISRRTVKADDRCRW